MSVQVVITGIGIVSSLGIGKNEVWDSIMDDKHGIKIKEEWDDYSAGSQYFGKVVAFNLRNYLKLKPPFPNYYSQLGLLATHLALQDGNLDVSSMEPYDVGCIMNTSFGSNESVEKYLIKLFEKGPGKVSPLTFTQTTNNHIVGDIARYNNFKGPNTIVMGEDSYSLGIKSIRNNQAKVMLCGGVDQIRDLRFYILNENDELLKPVSESPNSLFTKKAQEGSKNKYIIGEAACFIMLEEKTHALKRNAHIYAELKDTVTYNDLDASRLFINRDKKVLENLIKKSISNAEIGLNQIDMVIGSSTLPWLMNDYELKVMQKLKMKSMYTSILSRVGECFGASGTFSLATAAMAINEDFAPGCGYHPDFFSDFEDGITINSEGINKKDIDNVAVHSIHIGGSSSCTILKRP